MSNVNIRELPEKIKVKILWCGFSLDDTLPVYMVNLLKYCEENDHPILKAIADDIYDESKKRHRHAWSDCFGGESHTVFNRGCFFESEQYRPDYNEKNFEDWVTPVLDSHRDDPIIETMLEDIRETIKIENEQRSIQEMQRKEIIYQQKKRGFWGLFG